MKSENLKDIFHDCQTTAQKKEKNQSRRYETDLGSDLRRKENLQNLRYETDLGSDLESDLGSEV